MLSEKLIIEWDWKNNAGLDPTSLAPFSHKVINWVCSKCAYNWPAIVSSRTKGHGCPNCAGQVVTVENNLAIKFPEISSEWHPTRNIKTPKEFKPFANKYAWWICPKGHEYEMLISCRTSQVQGCSFCASKSIDDTNSLSNNCPEILAEWEYELNLPLNPDSITVSSHTKIFWRCINNHVWSSAPNARIKKKKIVRGCEMCSGKIATTENNLAIKFPELAKEWHPTLNGDLLPNDVTPFSSEKVWWKCANNPSHVWEAMVTNRSCNKTGCPKCCNQYTNLEKFVEDKLGIQKFDKKVLENSNFKPDFQLSDSLFLNVDGLYWHSELYREKDYHFKLREAFEAEGKRLLQFYEDEVYEKWDIVESIINNALGKISNKLDARECLFSRIDSLDAQEFLNKNHLMGSYLSAKHYGLLFEGELVSLLSIRKHEDSTLEISRFCNKINTNVRGAFSKLLSHVMEEYIPNKVISYCDLRYATGLSYKRNGFNQTGLTQGWCWTNTRDKKRYNRLYCKATSTQTEKEHAQELELFKLYDAGQARYELNAIYSQDKPR